jgi:hypothetical protein
MHFLKTDKGRISSRWIVRMEPTARGDWAVEYSNGSGAFDAHTSQAEAVTFLKRVDPDAAPVE